LAVGAALVPVSCDAQTEDGGGLQLTFGVEQRLESTDNLGLDVVNAGITTQANTRLSFGFLTETRSARLAVDTSAALRAVNGPGFSGTEVELSDPQISLAYSRTSAGAKFDFNGYLKQADVEFLRSLEEFIDETGQLVLPDDVTGTGTQLSYGLDVALNWGTDTPVEFGLSAGLSGLSYSDTTSASLVDSRRQRAGAVLRLDLTPVLEANIGLRYSSYDDDDPATTRRDTFSYQAGLDRILPNGKLTSDLTATDTEDGTRLSFSIGRDLDLPRGALSASVGATRSTSGATNLTGSLSLRKDFPLGQIRAEARRSVVAGSQDSERLATALSFGYDRSLTPVSSLGFDLSYVQNTEVATGLATTDASVGATYRRELTEDWGFDVGYRHRMRDEDGVGRAHSNSIFMVLRRDFNMRR
jgi:hypothetical protein